MEVNFSKLPGFYRLKGLRPQGIVLRGFSVNVDRSEINLDRISEDLLQTGLGDSTFVWPETARASSFPRRRPQRRELTPYTW